MSRGWHNRGYLPHCDLHELTHHVVFRLADSLPPWWRAPDDENTIDAFEAALDGGFGSALLARPACAQIVERALLHFDGDRYKLAAWCVMPTHVHALIYCASGGLGGIVKSWKAFSAARINEIVGRRGRLWAKDYFDRYMRDEAHFLGTQRYIERNPVAAGLCGVASEWSFGSAASKSKMRV